MPHWGVGVLWLVSLLYWGCVMAILDTVRETISDRELLNARIRRLQEMRNEPDWASMVETNGFTDSEWELINTHGVDALSTFSGLRLCKLWFNPIQLFALHDHLTPIPIFWEMSPAKHSFGSHPDN